MLNGVNSANAVDVCDGGTLARTGTVNVLNAVTIHDGGTLAPGSAANPTDTLTIGGSLAFQSGAFYFVQINGSADSFTHVTGVTGTATLDGAVVVNVSSAPVSKQTCTILTRTVGFTARRSLGSSSTTRTSFVS